MNKDEMKDKYSVFITEVSEIMGLGKPIDIIKLCGVTDSFFQPLNKRIEELKQQIEKMKCCSNCKHYHWSNGEDWCNDHYGQPMYDEECKDKWELKE